MNCRADCRRDAPEYGTQFCEDCARAETVERVPRKPGIVIRIKRVTEPAAACACHPEWPWHYRQDCWRFEGLEAATFACGLILMPRSGGRPPEVIGRYEEV